jgi:hypothetical protein
MQTSGCLGGAGVALAGQAKISVVRNTPCTSAATVIPCQFADASRGAPLVGLRIRLWRLKLNICEMECFQQVRTYSSFDIGFRLKINHDPKFPPPNLTIDFFTPAGARRNYIAMTLSCGGKAR